MLSQLKHLGNLLPGSSLCSKLCEFAHVNKPLKIYQRFLATPAFQGSSALQPCFKPSTGTSSSFRDTLVKPPSPVTVQSVRTIRVYYKGSAWKRYNKHNIEKRLTTPGGIEMLWRKTLKGRHQLAVYERILPNTVNGKILPAHHFKYKAHPLTKSRLPKPGLF